MSGYLRLMRVLYAGRAGATRRYYQGGGKCRSIGCVFAIVKHARLKWYNIPQVLQDIEPPYTRTMKDCSYAVHCATYSYSGVDEQRQDHSDVQEGDGTSDY